MTYEISLNNLHFYAYIGVEEEERRIGTEFLVSLTVTFPWHENTPNDNITGTVSYADLYKIVSEEMQCRRKLLETTSHMIAMRIKNEFPKVTGGHIRIEKMHPPIPEILGSASVTLNF